MPFLASLRQQLSRPGWPLRLLSPMAGLVFFGLALWSLRQSSLGEYGLDEIIASLKSLPPIRLAGALVLTVGGYLILVGYDLLAFRYVRRSVALGTTAAASLIASALSFNIGNTAVTGAALRYWIYSSLGLSSTQITRVALFCAAGFWLGYFFLGALLFSLDPVSLPAGLSIPIVTTRPLGLLFLGLLGFYVALTARRKPIRLGPWRMRLPSPSLTVGQILVATVDLCLMAAVLYVLLPSSPGVEFGEFVPLFLVALIGGIVSQVPGGLGVFETVMVLLLRTRVDSGDLAAALLAFRGIYYLLPLFLALGALALRQGLKPVQSLQRPFVTRGRSILALGAMGLAISYGFYRLARPNGPSSVRAHTKDVERARALATASALTHGYLALRGDKALLFSRTGDAFLMYGHMGRSWVAMGDPVGSEAGIRELVWRFRDLAERAGGWCVFFEVREDRRDLYTDLGLALTQIGEEARVDLRSFDLSTHRFKCLRRARNRLTHRGYVFEILPPEKVTSALPQLRQISDAWLDGKSTREKGFSTASFAEDYLARFPIAVVRREDEIVAFTNLWPGSNQEELSFDLMRHRPDAPHGTMDFLFTELMLWGKAEGFHCFNFGLAPLAGLERRDDGSLWCHIGILMYRYCSRFYSFDGLRRYKDKFHPTWTPLYLASPGGFALGPIIVDVAALLAGGVGGIISKGPRRIPGG